MQSRPRLSSGVLAIKLVFDLAEDNYNVHPHRTFWLLYCAPSSETIDGSWNLSGQLTFSGHFHVLLDCTTSTTSSFLSGLLALYLIPSIHHFTNSPTHPFIHPSTHPHTIYPSTPPPIHP